MVVEFPVDDLKRAIRSCNGKIWEWISLSGGELRTKIHWSAGPAESDARAHARTHAALTLWVRLRNAWYEFRSNLHRNAMPKMPSRRSRSTSPRWAKCTGRTGRRCRGSRPATSCPVTSWKSLVGPVAFAPRADKTRLCCFPQRFGGAGCLRMLAHVWVLVLVRPALDITWACRKFEFGRFCSWL